MTVTLQPLGANQSPHAILTALEAELHATIAASAATASQKAAIREQAYRYAIMFRNVACL